MEDRDRLRVACMYEQWRSQGRLLPVPGLDEWPPWEDLDPRWRDRFLYVLEPKVTRGRP